MNENEEKMENAAELCAHIDCTASTSAGAVVAATNSASVCAAKEKRSWFHSLTRRKKSQSQTSLATARDAEPPAPLPPTVTFAQLQSTNNNNEPLRLAASGERTRANETGATGTSRKRKDDKNVFQRLRKKMGLRFHSLRQRRHEDDDDSAGAGGTTDASAEFLTHSPIREPQLTFSFAHDATLEEPEMVPFTHNYKRFIKKKWPEQEAGPNRVMYKASSEMLSQVWYWGEISRRDAQRQLSDKPTGSFLVRDSETSDCQFTLSFRIVNVTLHYRLEYRDNYWHFEELQYESIVEMIEDILYRCTNDNFVCFVKVQNELQPPCPVILKYPLSRYFRMPTLQDLCRRVVQQHAAANEIANLPIPPKLQEYLSVKRELVFHS